MHELSGANCDRARAAEADQDGAGARPRRSASAASPPRLAASPRLASSLSPRLPMTAGRRLREAARDREGGAAAPRDDDDAAGLTGGERPAGLGTVNGCSISCTSCTSCGRTPWLVRLKSCRSTCHMHMGAKMGSEGLSSSRGQTRSSVIRRDLGVLSRSSSGVDPRSRPRGEQLPTRRSSAASRPRCSRRTRARGRGARELV